MRNSFGDFGRPESNIHDTFLSLLILIFILMCLITMTNYGVPLMGTDTPTPTTQNVPSQATVTPSPA